MIYAHIKVLSNSTVESYDLINYIYIFVDGTRITFPPLVTNEAMASLMAQMTAAAASAAASSAGLPKNLIPSSSATSEIVQQAMWLSRAQKLFEDEHQKNLLLKEINSTKDSSDLALAFLNQGMIRLLNNNAIQYGVEILLYLRNF